MSSPVVSVLPISGGNGNRGDVELITDGDSTLLKYMAKAEPGGKIAQLGGRLITSTARKLSKMFFTKFEKIMSDGESPPEEEDSGETALCDPVSG